MSIEAMKQALEALEETTALCINYEAVEEPNGYQFTEAKSVIPMGNSAITALRAAIEQAEKAEPVAECDDDDKWNCKYCNKTKTCKALQDKRNFRTPHPSQPPEGWQPIETAPKDGTEILVSVNFGLHVVSYDDIFSAPWRVFNEFGFNEHVPTHWMPLPAAPKEKS